MSYEPIRPFTKQQEKIAEGIAQSLSYAEIGASLVPKISAHTVQAHVRHMGLLLDEPKELPPRWRILFWVKCREWQGGSAADPVTPKRRR